MLFIVLSLLRTLGITAGTHYGTWRLHKKALTAKRVKEFTVMADQQTNPMK